MASEKYREIVWAIKGQVWKTKTLIEPNLLRNIKGNKKSFYRDISTKRQTREIVGPLQKEMGDLVTSGMEKVEVPNSSFDSVLTSRGSSHIAQVAERKGRNQENEEPHTGAEDQVQDHLRNMKMHKSMRPPWDLSEFSEELLSHYP